MKMLIQKAHAWLINSLILLAALTLTLSPRAETVSGVQNLAGTSHQGKQLANLLMHQAKLTSCTMGVSGCLDVAKGAKGPIQHTKHSLNQKINRQVKSKDELDAVRNPLDVGAVKVDSRGRPSQRYVGKKAEVAINPETGKAVSINPTSSKKAARLQRRLDRK